MDIYYLTSNPGTRTEPRVNPFMRQVQTVPVDDLTDVEWAAVLRLLHAHDASGPNKFGNYVLNSPDGGTAGIEIDADYLHDTGRCDCLLVSLQTLTAGLLGFLWALSQNVGLTAVPMLADAVTLVVSEEQRQRIIGRWPDAVVVGSPQELELILSAGVAAWQAYRDQAVGDDLDS